MIEKRIATNVAGETRARFVGRRRIACPLMAAAMCLVRFSGAAEPDRYPPPRPLPGWSAEGVAEPSHLPADGPGFGDAPIVKAPKLLPARYQSQPAVDSAASGGATDAPSPEVESTGSARPLPLSRQSRAPLSPLGGLSGGDKTQLVDAATSLGIVLGLFLLVAWAVRRTAPKGSGLLPTEAVEVLGRASLPGRGQAHLVRCGNKIVLLNITPTGTQTLAEISDPAEVDRLYSVCQPTAGRPAGHLRRFLSHFTGASRSSEYFSREEADGVDFRHLELGGQRRA